MRSGAHGLRVGPNAECSVDEPIANSSQLVLPMTIAPARSRRSTTAAEYGRHVVLEQPRPGGRRHAGRADVVLERDGDAEQRRAGGSGRDRVRPRARARARRPRGGTRAARDRAAAMRSSAARQTSTAETVACRDRGANLGGAFRDAHEPSTRGTLKRPAARSAAGACASTSVAIERRPQLVVAQLRARRGCAAATRRLRSVHLLDLVGVGEDRGQLRGESRAFVVGQLQARERGDPIDVGGESTVAMATDSIRPAAVAGSWYPGTAGALARDVDAHLAGVEDAALAVRPDRRGDRAACRPDVLGAGRRVRLQGGRRRRARTTPRSSSVRRISSPSTASRSIRRARSRRRSARPRSTRRSRAS